MKVIATVALKRDARYMLYQLSTLRIFDRHIEDIAATLIHARRVCHHRARIAGLIYLDSESSTTLPQIAPMAELRSAESSPIRG